MLLTEVIASHIKAKSDRLITFAEFMELALYHPQYGYYSTKAVDIGSQGDFFTSPHLGKDFGELLAVQFAQMWENMGQPVTFTLVEMGAGQGILAVDILKYLSKHYRDFFDCLQYIIVEVSPALKQQQQQLLQGVADKVKWCKLSLIHI